MYKHAGVTDRKEHKKRTNAKLAHNDIKMENAKVRELKYTGTNMVRIMNSELSVEIVDVRSHKSYEILIEKVSGIFAGIKNVKKAQQVITPYML